MVLERNVTREGLSLLLDVGFADCKNRAPAQQLLETKAAEVKRLQMEKASLNAELIERNQRQQQYGQDDVMAEKHRILKR